MGLGNLFRKKKTAFDEDILRLIQKDKTEALRHELDLDGLWDHWQEYESLSHSEHEQATVYIMETRGLLAITIDAISPRCVELALEKADLTKPVAIRVTMTTIGHCDRDEILAKGFKTTQRQEKMIKPFVEEWLKRMERLLISQRQEDARDQRRVLDIIALLRDATSFDFSEFVNH